MQYSIVLTVLAAAGAIALPTQDKQDQVKETNVLLKGNNVAAWRAIGFRENQKDTLTDSQVRVFTTAELSLAKDVRNKDLRCQLRDADDKRVVVTRGANIDFTLGDGDKGAWTLKPASQVKTVTCDPALKKIAPEDVNAVRVILDNGLETLHFKDDEVKHDVKKDIKKSSLSQVELFLGPGIENQGLRCAVLDSQKHKVPLQRGTSKADTFADAGKGPWTFQRGPTDIYTVVCSPSFKK